MKNDDENVFVNAEKHILLQISMSRMILNLSIWISYAAH